MSAEINGSLDAKLMVPSPVGSTEGSYQAKLRGYGDGDVHSLRSAAPTQVSRKDTRVSVREEVRLRRPGNPNFIVSVYNASCHGCRIDFVERPKSGNRIWVKFDGLEGLVASVRWVDGFVGGVEFEHPIHPAVFGMLKKRGTTWQNVGHRPELRF